MTNYLLNLEVRTIAGQLLRCTDMHFKTRKEAIKTTVKMIWIITGKQSSQYEVFQDEIFHCQNGDVLVIKLTKYEV